MNFIVGDSRAKILKDVMGNLVVEEVWARPGGKIVHMEKMVNDLTYLHHGESNEKSHFYIWVGICDITTRLRDYKSKYEEVIVDIEEIELKRARMLEDLRKLTSTTINQYGKPIFCPIIPMNISAWNHHRKSCNKTTKLEYQKDYAHMQKILENEVSKFNEIIIEINKSNNVVTPMINKDFLHNRGKGRATPMYWELVDGCHPSKNITTKFRKSLKAAIRANRTNLRS